MEEIVYSLNLDLRKNTHQVLVMKEDDVNSRVIEAVITDNGKPYDLTNCVVNLKWRKPDNHIVYITAEKSDYATVRVVCSDQMLAVAGTAEAEFDITGTTAVASAGASTLKFMVSINETVVAISDIESSDEFGALQDIMGHISNESIHIPSGGSSGQILRWSADGTAVWGSDNNTTYSNATTSASGLMSASDKAKLDAIATSADSVSFTRSLTSGTKIGTITINGTGTDLYCQTNTNTNTDTKNTAGSTNSSSKLFLVGATSQAANPQTYSHDTIYAGTDGHIYSNSKQAVNLSDTQALTNKTYNGYTLAAACAKTVTDSSSASAIGTGTSLVTERDVYYGLPTINGSHTYTSSTKIYAPTSVGTSGYTLHSNGGGAPSWVNIGEVVTRGYGEFVSGSSALTWLEAGYTLTPGTWIIHTNMYMSGGASGNYNVQITNTTLGGILDYSARYFYKPSEGTRCDFEWIVIVELESSYNFYPACISRPDTGSSSYYYSFTTNAIRIK